MYRFGTKLRAEGPAYLSHHTIGQFAPMHRKYDAPY